ncbi:hypothetical protein ACH4D5_35795 [Streptomyces sp. NPDC018029]|uniref:hypothetical protein n=1 Tax=Streptomyces sp. NPDC018029 TaxID=3365032 RepID=UPI0037A08789
MEQDEEQAPVSDAASAPTRRRDYKTCLAMVVVIACVVCVPAVGGELWGRDVWRWAGVSWPGGVYSFAVLMGLSVPGLLLLLFAALTSLDWQRHAVRSFAWAGAAFGGFIVLIAIGGAVVDTWPFGGGRRGGPGGTDTSRQYPSLWAAGLGATVVGILVLTVLILMSEKKRRLSHN